MMRDGCIRRPHQINIHKRYHLRNNNNKYTHVGRVLCVLPKHHFNCVLLCVLLKHHFNPALIYSHWYHQYTAFISVPRFPLCPVSFFSSSSEDFNLARIIIQHFKVFVFVHLFFFIWFCNGFRK